MDFDFFVAAERSFFVFRRKPIIRQRLLKRMLMVIKGNK